jgi:hypothetical protein
VAPRRFGIKPGDVQQSTRHLAVSAESCGRIGSGLSLPVTSRPALALFSALLLASSACSRNDASQDRAGPLSVGPQPNSVLVPGTVAIGRDRVLAPVAAAGHRLVWVSGPLESEDVVPTLLTKLLPSGRVTELAQDVVPGFGLAVEGGLVLFAAAAGDGSAQLIAIHPDGTGRRVLARFLIAPIASRGRLVAWAEQVGDRQRVVVLDLPTGREWTAADLSRCTPECYRIDAVALADRGVVFTRGAVSSQTSYIVRRGFDDADFEQVAIPNDPQPDLVPSSDGALYYSLYRGWYRWDFGEASPRLTPFARPQPAPLLRFEDGRWFLLYRDGCAQRLVVRLTDGRIVESVSPAGLRRRAGVHERVCVQLADLDWTGEQLLSSWFLVPQSEEESHEEHGLVGLLVAGPKLAR